MVEILQRSIYNGHSHCLNGVAVPDDNAMAGALGVVDQ